MPPRLICSGTPLAAESPNGYSWKGPLEITQSDRARPPRAGDKGMNSGELRLSPERETPCPAQTARSVPYHLQSTALSPVGVKLVVLHFVPIAAHSGHY